MKKLFIVRNYVMASSVAEAVRVEKKQDADDCWLDDDWKKSQPNSGANVMGFAVRPKTHAIRKRKKP